MAAPGQLSLLPLQKEIVIIPDFFTSLLKATKPGVASFPGALAERNRVRHQCLLTQIRKVPHFDIEIDSEKVGFKRNIKIGGAGGEGSERPRSQGKVQQPPPCLCRRSASHGNIRRYHNPMKVFGHQRVANLFRLPIPVSNFNPLKVHFLNKGGNGYAPVLVRALIQTQAWQKVSANNQDRKALGSVDDAPIALRLQRLVMAPSSEAGLAKNELSSTVVKLLPGIIMVRKVNRRVIVVSSKGWCGKSFPPHCPELPPNLVQVGSQEMAFSDRNNVGNFVTKGQLGKVCQGLLVANCNIEQLDADAAGITLTAVRQRPMLDPLAS